VPLQFTPIPYIKIGGADVPQDFAHDLIEVVVDSSLYLPSMFTIKLTDAQLKWADDTRLDIGKEVQISFKTGEQSGAQEALLIKGEITALEPHFGAEGNTFMLVRGYDKSHRLHRGKKTRTFLKMTDGDIVSKIAGEAGLSPSVDSTSVTHDFVLQNNQTNMELLMARAERIGYQVYSAEGKLYFKKGDANLGNGPDLVYLENLTSFAPCYTASGQADKMSVKGWDPKNKQAITSQATPPGSLNQGGLGKTGGAAASSAFSSAEAIVTDQPVYTADEAKEIATGLSDDIAREFVQAEGTCQGDPRLLAGRKVTITKVGTRFSGTYYITAATHIYTQDGYETQFTISGRQPNTLSHLLESGNGQGRGMVEGVVVGLVTNNKDPDDRGRIKVKYTWLGDNIESDWMRIAAPMAGATRGFFYLPEVNDEVLIAFEHGDVHHPYVVGALWSSKDAPPKKNSEAVGGDGKVNQRVLKTRQGHTIILDDKQGEEQISVTSKSGHTIILNDKSGSESITIKDKTGSNSMVIDSAKNSMTIAVNGDFTVDAKGKVTIKSTQALALESQANGTVKAMQLTLEGVTKAEVKGPTVSVAGSAMTEVKGGIVKIN
jgi:phage protein D/phage baseplate assembly protein gpV